MPKQPEPTPHYITQMNEAAADEFSERDLRDATRDMLYWQENPIPHPSHVDFQPVHMGVATEVVTRVKGILDDRPIVQVTTTSPKELVIRRTTKVEDYLNALWPALEDDADFDTWDSVLEDVIRFGRAYDELLYVPSTRSTKAPGYPSRDRGESAAAYLERKQGWNLNAKLPLLWRHLPARNVFPWYDDEGLAECTILEVRRVGDVTRRYDLPKLMREVEADNISRLDYVYFVRYYSRDWTAYWVSSTPAGRYNDVSLMEGVSALRQMASGELAKVTKNIYGCVPIVETSGITSSDQRRAKKQLSIFDHMIPICMYLDQLMSQKGTAVRMWAWPTPFLKNLGIRGSVIQNQPMAPDGRPQPLPIVPGEMLMLLPGEDIGWLVAPDNGAGADEMIQVIKNQADLLGITSAVFSTEALGSNGYLYNSVLNAIRSKYSPVVKHVKRSHRQRCYHALDMIELYGEDLHIRRYTGTGPNDEDLGQWLKLGPTDVRDAYYQIDVHFEDHLPTDDASDMALAVQATSGENPLMDINHAREKYLRDNAPERTQDRIFVEKVLQMPPVQEFLMAKAIEQAGITLDQQKQGSAPSPDQAAGLPPALQSALGIQPPPAPAGGPPAAAPGPPGPMPPGTPMPMGAGAAPVPRTSTGAPGGPTVIAHTGPAPIGPPSAVGGAPGAPAMVGMPGINKSLTPPPPQRPPNPVAQHPMTPRRPAGRPAGQSRRPHTPAKKPRSP